ncbi:MAG: sugar ABC transporter permease [Geminicoccaceae bacterium]
MSTTSGQALAGRTFRYGMVWPAVFVILLIGLFPIIYTLIVSFQNFDMFGEDTSFHGMVHYRRLFADARFWESILHTLIFLAVALPLELVLGLLLALLFLDRMPGKQIFVALLILPVVTSPIIAGATWRLLFDNRFGPINQIISWFARRAVAILWTVNPWPCTGDPARQSGSGRPSCSYCCWPASMSTSPRRRRPLDGAALAGLLVRDPADHQAGDLHRLPDPWARPLPASSTSSGRSPAAGRAR